MVFALTDGTYQLEIIAQFDDDSTADVTGSATDWTSSHPEVATVSATGLLTAVSGGDTTITAVYGDVTATFHVTVTAAAVEKLNFTLLPIA